MANASVNSRTPATKSKRKTKRDLATYVGILHAAPAIDENATTTRTLCKRDVPTEQVCFPHCIVDIMRKGYVVCTECEYKAYWHLYRIELLKRKPKDPPERSG